jgi:hypothetical protein
MFLQAIQAATRPNGSVNISALLEQLEGRVALLIIKLERDQTESELLDR